MKAKLSPHGKTDVVKARVTADMKHRIAEISERRGESEGIIVREAIRQYFTRKKAGFNLPAWDVHGNARNGAIKTKKGRSFANEVIRQGG